MLETFRYGEPIVVDEGGYMRWKLECGAELWAILTSDKRFVGLTPHFAGTSMVDLGLVERVSSRRDSPMNVAWRAVGHPHDDDPTRGDAELVFACPDGTRHGDLQLPSRVTVQLTAFTRELEVYRHEQLFRDAYPDAGPFEERVSHVPGAALFGTHRVAGAVITGRVLESTRRINEVTGARFAWAALRTSIGVIDVVASPESIEGDLRPGVLVAGTFWLSGRLQRRLLPSRTLLRRLLDR